MSRACGCWRLLTSFQRQGHLTVTCRLDVHTSRQKGCLGCSQRVERDRDSIACMRHMSFPPRLTHIFISTRRVAFASENIRLLPNRHQRPMLCVSLSQHVHDVSAMDRNTMYVLLWLTHASCFYSPLCVVFLSFFNFLPYNFFLPTISIICLQDPCSHL